MPGISAIITKSGGKSISADFCTKIRKEMLHFPFYLSKQIVTEKWANIGFTGYKEYPLKIINHEDFDLVLEGRIYNLKKDSLDDTLHALAQSQVHSLNTFDDELKRFLLTAEGEFILTIYDKVHTRLILANDMMGRLPLYYFQNGDSIIFSRELKFILPFLDYLNFDKAAILEYLLYGFPFGENTLVQHVGFYPPATYLNFCMMSGKSSRESYHLLNIDTCESSGNRKKMAAKMARIFMSGLSDRVDWVDKTKTIVSLSGGFDSRGTLGGLKKLGVSPTAVTAQSEEESSARKVAACIGADVYTMPQGRVPDEMPFADIVFLKDGLDCHPNLAQLYQNLENLRNQFGGDIVYFTGIFGGEITRHSHPTTGLSSLNSLVQYLLSANDSYKYSTKNATAILQISEDDIQKHLRRHLEDFPEINIARKYVRFRHEYDTRFAGEAEDRNRFYFWTISPFFAFPFFKFVMSIAENKKSSWLFRDFLFAIDPRTCEAKYFNYYLPLNNPFVLWVLSRAERMSRHVFVKNSMRRIARLIKGTVRLLRPRSNANKLSAMQSIKEELINLLKTSKPVKEFFSNSELPELIQKETDIKGLERLQIIFAYMDRATSWHNHLSENHVQAVRKVF